MYVYQDTAEKQLLSVADAVIPVVKKKNCAGSASRNLIRNFKTRENGLGLDTIQYSTVLVTTTQLET